MTKQWLVAMNDNGEFFGLNESEYYTSPFVTQKLIHAKLMRYNGESIEDPGYYFEKRWSGNLRGFHMVAVSETIEETDVSTRRSMIVHNELRGETHVDLSADLADTIRNKATTHGWDRIGELDRMFLKVLFEAPRTPEGRLKYAMEHEWNGREWL